MTAILLGGSQSNHGKLVENVTCPEIWTPFEEYVITNILTEEGFIVYLFKCKKKHVY